jgi:hypothetical protein
MRACLLVLAAALALAVAPSAVAAGPPARDRALPTDAEVFGDATLTVKQRRVGGSEVPAKSAEERLAVATATACWEMRWTYRKDGWWGYWQVWQQTYWCGNSSYAITYRSTQEGASSGGACAVNGGAQSWRTGGGVGSWYVDVQTQASFSCFVGWNNGSPWFNIRYTAGGSYFLQGYGER